MQGQQTHRWIQRERWYRTPGAGTVVLASQIVLCRWGRRPHQKARRVTRCSLTPPAPLPHHNRPHVRHGTCGRSGQSDVRSNRHSCYTPGRAEPRSSSGWGHRWCRARRNTASPGRSGSARPEEASNPVPASGVSPASGSRRRPRPAIPAPPPGHQQAGPQATPPSTPWRSRRRQTAPAPPAGTRRRAPMTPW